MSKADDLAYPAIRNLDNCYMDEDGYEFEIQANRPRATATGYFAQELGVRFQDVSCRRVWIRPLTRQESYEYRSMDRAIDDWIDAHDPPLHIDRETLKWTDHNGNECEPPEHLDHVPDGWQPDESDPVWEFCGKDHHEAIPGWRLEEKS